MFRKIVGTKTYECRAIRAVQRPVAKSPSKQTRKDRAVVELSAAVSASGNSSSYYEESQSEKSTSVEEVKFETVYEEN